MSLLWLIYWISVATDFLLAFILKKFFVIDGKSMPRFYMFIIMLIAFIPIIGSILALTMLVCMILGVLIGDDYFKLNKHPFKNEKINDFFMK